MGNNKRSWKTFKMGKSRSVNPVHSIQDFSTWGGYCRIHVTATENCNAVTAADMHNVCRFCLLALNHNDAVSRLTKSGIADFAFLTRSESQVEMELTHNRHGILNHPMLSVDVYVAHPSVSYLSGGSYTLFVHSDAPDPLSATGMGTLGSMGGMGGPVDTTNTSSEYMESAVMANTPRSRGFLDRLTSSFRGLLDKPWNGK